MKVQAFRDLIGQCFYQLNSLKSAATPAERLAEARRVLRDRAELVAAAEKCGRATPADRERMAGYITEACRVLDDAEAAAPGFYAELCRPSV